MKFSIKQNRLSEGFLMPKNLSKNTQKVVYRCINLNSAKNSPKKSLLKMLDDSHPKIKCHKAYIKKMKVDINYHMF
jgi:hypothetical protein